MKGQDLILRSSRRRVSSIYLVMAAVIVWALLMLGRLYRSFQTAGTLPDSSSTSTLDREKCLWGSYRGNIYFGMRMAKPTSITTGMMWFGMQDFAACKSNPQPLKVIKYPGIRHECDIRDGMKWGWLEHDGENYGKEVLEDYANNVKLTASFHKTSDQSWKAHIEGEPIKLNHTMIVSWLHYLSYNGPEYSIKYDDNAPGETKASGWTNESGKFSFSIKYSGDNEHRNQAIKVEPSQQWRIKEIVSFELTRTAFARVDTEKNLSPEHLFLLDNKPSTNSSNVFITQLVFNGAFKIELEFTGNTKVTPSSSGSSPVLVDHQALLSEEFTKKFDGLFLASTKEEDVKMMAKTALSNLLGGISYFYGRGIIYQWIDGVKKPIETEPFELMTDTPSRTTFPRGFLWDSGFHNLIILKWNPLVSLKILVNWAERIDQYGWVAREQIPGEEARSRVPIQHWPQNPNFANPPGLLLPLLELTKSFDDDDTFSSIKIIKSILPHFERNLNWYLKTQQGTPHPSIGLLEDTKGLYRWRGRSRHHTLTSGLDDYPRGNTSNEYELHTDLASWMAFAARTLQRVRISVGLSGDDNLDSVRTSAINSLESLHWNENLGCYNDRTIDDDGNFIHVAHVGYVSIFPLLFGLVDPESPRLSRLLDIIEDKEQLWTSYGIRSLSASDPFYMLGDQYWTGPIWININYLLLASLKLNYMDAATCPYHERVSTIYNDLRANLIENMTKQYRLSGFIWEQYDDTDGHGKRSHPFTGWSALIILVITENYPIAIKI